jgi:uncharacterized membrane protein YjjB (DUF3815 family)
MTAIKNVIKMIAAIIATISIAVVNVVGLSILILQLFFSTTFLGITFISAASAAMVTRSVSFAVAALILGFLFYLIRHRKAVAIVNAD